MKEARYKNGEKVLITDNYHITMDGVKGHSVMGTFCGKEMTVSKSFRMRNSTKSNDYSYYYEMVEDEGRFSWLEKLIKSRALEKDLGISSFTLPMI